VANYDHRGIISTTAEMKEPFQTIIQPFRDFIKQVLWAPCGMQALKILNFLNSDKGRIIRGEDVFG